MTPPWMLLLNTGAALAGVLLLMAGLAAVGRRWPGLKPPGAASQALALRGALRLDSRRSLYLVEVEGQRFVILAGGETDSLVKLGVKPEPGGV
jgi:flagellar biogenesis protein FliO